MFLAYNWLHTWFKRLSPHLISIIGERVHVERRKSGGDASVVQARRVQQRRGAHLVYGADDLALDADRAQYAGFRCVEADAVCRIKYKYCLEKNTQIEFELAIAG